MSGCAIFVPPDFTRYRAVSKSVREIFKLHTDLIEPLSLDEAYLDVTENKRGLVTATLVARTIREQIRQELNLTASAGVAPNKFLAKLASDWRKPDGLFVIQPDEIETFLLPLPVGRLPGVGKVTGGKLAKLGVQTVADLRNLDLPALEHQFGRHGLRLHELARGVDDSAVVPDTCGSPKRCALHIKRFLSSWRKLFGLELQVRQSLQWSRRVLDRTKAVPCPIQE